MEIMKGVNENPVCLHDVSISCNELIADISDSMKLLILNRLCH